MKFSRLLSNDAVDPDAPDKATAAVISALDQEHKRLAKTETFQKILEEEGVITVDALAWRLGIVWVPETLSPHATWAYSWRRPPSLSRRMTLTSSPMGSGSARSGLAWFSARCGRCPLKWDSYS